MARVILAMANSSMTRCGRLLSSAMARGTALGSTLSAPGCAAPGVVTLAAACFIGDEALGFFAETEDGDIESELLCESCATAALSNLDCRCLNSCGVMPACLGCGYSWMSFGGRTRSEGRPPSRDSTARSSTEVGFNC